MRFVDLVATSAAVPATSGRRAKVELLAAALRGLAPDEIVPGAAYLAGDLRQRQTGVGYASLRDLPPPADRPTLGIGEVDAAVAGIAAVSGPRPRRTPSTRYAPSTPAGAGADRPYHRGLRGGCLSAPSRAAGRLSEASSR